jgi:hydrogenase maturation protease
MGNPYLSDDAVGIRLARDFKSWLEGIPNLDIVEECSVGGLELLPLIEDYQRLVIIDSTKTTGGIPGKWYYFTAERLRETMNLTNIHDANFVTALELGRRLGMKLPANSEVHIFAVEIADSLTFAEQLTEALQRGYPQYSSEIFNCIVELIASPPGFLVPVNVLSHAAGRI